MTTSVDADFDLHHTGRSAAVTVHGDVVERFSDGGDDVVEEAPLVAAFAREHHAARVGHRAQRDVALSELALHLDADGWCLLHGGTEPSSFCGDAGIHRITYISFDIVTASVGFIKRTLDIFLALAGLIVTAPLFPLIALAIYRESPGPVFFRQRRAGRLVEVPNGEGPRRFRFEEFEMLKFRTMRVGAEKERGVVLAEENDPRITKVGRILRRLRLDELPQLVNVLRGDMSVIGPRPEQPQLIDHLSAAIPYFEERMRGVKPGITGFAQVSLGYTGRPLPGSPILAFREVLTNPFKVDEAEGALADDMRIKLLYDLAYGATLQNLADFLRMELYILFRTPWVMIRGVGR
jgi:lipopolysaccharide/colanic/teichoic acid biosynthesis glycosyltransferase